MIEREDAERLRKVGTLGQIDEDDPSFLFRIADHIEAELAAPDNGFTPTHAHVVHQAMVEAKHEAKERREKMPSSADALERRAAELLTVRNMILDRLPPEHHSHRLAYPDYKPWIDRELAETDARLVQHSFDEVAKRLRDSPL